MNKFLGIGRLCKDVELRYANTNQPMLKNTLAIDRGYGEKKQTSFISIVAFGKTAEFLAKYFVKGSKIAVEGFVTTGSYEHEGKKVYTTDIFVEKVNFVESKNIEQQTTTNPYDFQEEEEDIYSSMGERVSLDDSDID